MAKTTTKTIGTKKTAVGSSSCNTGASATAAAAVAAMASTKSKKVDKWEEFREKKLAEMKQHKMNVERRMQTSCNIDGQMYWSQRADKLKRYPKHEALHPSWYTENIYSNHSIDLETDDFFYGDDQYSANDYDRELFHRKKTHIDMGYGYPKSRSCCFGSGYDERPKPVLMPKSSSFTGTGNRGVSNIRTMYSTVEEESFLEVRRPNNSRNNMNRSGLRKFYCWENDRHQNIDKDELYASNGHQFDDDCYLKSPEIYQIERDRNYYAKPSVDMHDSTTNANYIRNIWHNRNRSASMYKVQNVNEINGNYLEDYNNMSYDMRPKRHHELDTHHPFEEEYLIIHQNKPNINVYSARNSFDDPGSVSRRQSYHSNEMYASDVDPYPNDRSNYRDKNLTGMGMNYSGNRDHHHHPNRHSVRSKSMLEVIPPNRYDDTSSDSTIDDLYDFNFDFAHQYDLDYRNNNSNNKCALNKNSLYNASSSSFKEKNINIDNYSKYRKNNIDSIDDTDNDLNDVDFDNNSQSDEDEDINFNSLTSPRHERRYQSSSQDNDYLLSNRNANDRFYDNCLSSPAPPSSSLPPLPQPPSSEFYPAINNNNNNNNNNNSINNNHNIIISPNGNAAANNKDHHHHHQQINNMDLDDNKNNIDPLTNDTNLNNNGHETSGGAISLFNNIFSIYKPRKYSPVRASNRKPCTAGVTKTMNVSSTVRPLGAPYNDFLTSMKRPLTITPSCFTTQKRNWIVPSSASVDQAHFKIIPEKTGLKISPLYRFGYEDDSKLRLKCTARPLLFPL